MEYFDRAPDQDVNGSESNPEQTKVKQAKWTHLKNGNERDVDWNRDAQLKAVLNNLSETQVEQLKHAESSEEGMAKLAQDVTEEQRRKMGLDLKRNSASSFRWRHKADAARAVTKQDAVKELLKTEELRQTWDKQVRLSPASQDKWLEENLSASEYASLKQQASRREVVIDVELESRLAEEEAIDIYWQAMASKLTGLQRAEMSLLMKQYSQFGESSMLSRVEEYLLHEIPVQQQKEVKTLVDHKKTEAKSRRLQNLVERHKKQAQSAVLKMVLPEAKFQEFQTLEKCTKAATGPEEQEICQAARHRFLQTCFTKPQRAIYDQVYQERQKELEDIIWRSTGVLSSKSI